MPDVVRTPDIDWTPLHEDGVDTEGLSVKVLRLDNDGRPPTFLLRFDPGATYPHHVHPGGEEAFVVEGAVRFGSVALQAGDYLYTPPGGTHSVSSASGCVVLFVVPEEVDIL